MKKKIKNKSNWKNLDIKSSKKKQTKAEQKNGLLAWYVSPTWGRYPLSSESKPEFLTRRVICGAREQT